MRWAFVAVFVLAACGRSSLSPTANVEPESEAPGGDVIGEQTFLVTAPADGATVSGIIIIDGEAGPKWINVAAYVDPDVKVAQDASPRHNLWELTLDTRQFPNGPVTIAVVGFDVPPGGEGDKIPAYLNLNVLN